MKTVSGIILLSCLLVNCKKSIDINASTYAAERNWIHDNGGVYKNEKLTMKSVSGATRTASLNWSNVHSFLVGTTRYVEVPFTFTGPSNDIKVNGISDNDVSFSFMFRNINGKTEVAIKFTQRNVKVKNGSAERSGSVISYNNLDGSTIDMWFLDDTGVLMTMRKKTPANVYSNGLKQIRLDDDFGGAGCSPFPVPVYEFHCWITGGSYNDTACGWVLVGTTTHYLCLNPGTTEGGGGTPGGSWPPPGGGGLGTPSPPTTPPNQPCAGDALANPTIAATPRGKEGGRMGMTRTNLDGTPKFHGGLDLAAVPNTPVFSAFDGVVVTAKSIYPPTFYGAGSFGNQVVIRSTDPNGQVFYTLYAHLNSASVTVNTTISAGDQIGLSGKTGNAQHVQNPHVHIQIKTASGTLINPEEKLATKFNTAGNSTGRPCN